MLLVISAWILLLMRRDLLLTICVLGILHLLLREARIPGRNILFIWKVFLPIGILIPVLWALFYQHGIILFQLGPFQISLDGFILGTVLALRLVSLALVVFLWLVTTDPRKMTLGLVKLGVPYEWGLVITLALNYIPAFQRSFLTILEAQQARGLRLTGSLYRRTLQLMPAFVAMVISSLRLTDQLAKALESRAFGARGVKRTIYAELSFTSSDAIAGLLILFGLAAGFLFF